MPPPLRFESKLKFQLFLISNTGTGKSATLRYHQEADGYIDSDPSTYPDKVAAIAVRRMLVGVADSCETGDVTFLGPGLANIMQCDTQLSTFIIDHKSTSVYKWWDKVYRPCSSGCKLSDCDELRVLWTPQDLRRAPLTSKLESVRAMMNLSSRHSFC
eukprot:g5111.t1